MNLLKFPRRCYTRGYTPLERMARLTKLCGGPDIYIKRDDLLGLTGGGNKTRKLEFLVAEALAKGTDTLITSGAVQSNHCRLTLAAAATRAHGNERCRRDSRSIAQTPILQPLGTDLAGRGKVVPIWRFHSCTPCSAVRF